MTEDDVKSIPRIEREIEKRENRLVYLREKAESAPTIDTSKEKVCASTLNRSNVLMDSIIDLEKEVEKEKDHLRALQYTAMLKLGSCADSIEEKQLLQYRYLCCYTWEYVAKLLHVHERTARRMHYNLMRRAFEEKK